MTLDASFLALLLAAAIAVVVTVRMRLFTPAPMAPQPPGAAGGKPGMRTDGQALPFLFGAFAVYSTWMLVGLFVSMQTGLAEFALPAQGTPPLPRAEPSPLLVARTQLLVILLAAPLAIAIAWWTSRQSARPMDLSPSRAAQTALWGLCWSLVILPIAFAVSLLAAQLSNWLGQPVDRTAHAMLKLIVDESGEGGARTRWMLIGTAVVGAPILEELCYRALLQRGLLLLVRSPWLAVLATSTLFTAMHAGVIPAASFWPAATTLFVLSVFLGLLLVRTGSVITTIVVHAMFNAVSIVAALRGW